MTYNKKIMEKRYVVMHLFNNFLFFKSELRKNSTENSYFEVFDHMRVGEIIGDFFLIQEYKNEI
jgi:hypothetical protein